MASAKQDIDNDQTQRKRSFLTEPQGRLSSVGLSANTSVSLSRPCTPRRARRTRHQRFNKTARLT
eukprot:scaffold5006_cov71-Phaeocystis_antarctica.AAC.2